MRDVRLVGSDFCFKIMKKLLLAPLEHNHDTALIISLLLLARAIFVL